MDVLASYSIFQELQLVHDTGYFSALPSLEENWQQVNHLNYSCKSLKCRQSVPWGCISDFILFLFFNSGLGFFGGSFFSAWVDL